MTKSNIIWPASGRYVLAVSGGADSMVLLHLFASAALERKFDLIVAHFDHGLRPESAEDAVFVATAARSHDLPFESAATVLDSTSEAAARHARHFWLDEVRQAHAAAAVVTAHHQDDLLETSLLNLARGSGRLGLAPMAPDGPIARPLIELTRADLRSYAATHNIAWREDPTNVDVNNARNLVRHRLLADAPTDWRAAYLKRLEALTHLNQEIDLVLAEVLNTARHSADTFVFERINFQNFTQDVAAEIIVAAARSLRPGIQLDSPLVRETVKFAQTGSPHKHRPLRQGLIIKIENAQIRLTTNSVH